MAHIASDWRNAGLGNGDSALCRFAEELTSTPAERGAERLAELRRAGFDDVAIHDASQIVAYFNYINRVAEALGVEEETFVKAWELEISRHDGL